MTSEMSYKCGELFSVEYTLKHTCYIRVSESLWKHPNIREKIKETVLSHRLGSNADEKLVSYMIINRLQQLKLPSILKKDLESYVGQMGKHMLCYLRKELHSSREEDKTHKLCELIKNICWNDLGSLNTRAILESYVKDKEIIDYQTWCSLCDHFSEDYVRKFASCVNWSESGPIRCRFVIYWYQELYDKFPEDVFFNQTEILGMQRDSVVKVFLIESMKVGNKYGVKYLWPRLTEEEKKDVLHSSSCSSFLYSAYQTSSYVYLLGQVRNEDQDLLRHHFHQGETLLAQWPWALCIQPWRNVFEVCCNQKRYFILTSIAVLILMAIRSDRNRVENSDCVRELGKSDYKGIVFNTYVRILEDLWEVYGEDGFDFSRSWENIRIFEIALELEDIFICKLIFGGDRAKRKVVFKGFVDCKEEYSCDLTGVREEFLREFEEEVLEDEEERIFFRKVLKEHCEELN